MSIKEDALDEKEPLRASKENKSNARKLEENFKTLKSTGEKKEKMTTKKERLLLFGLLVYGIFIFVSSFYNLSINYKL